MDVDISQVTMDLSLLLVGRDGNGKSSTGNSILGGKHFTPTSNCSSVGVEIQKASATVSGKNVTVTEVAGLEYPDADIEGNIEDTLRQIEKTITENKNGFNAVIIVLKFGVRFTKQEKDALLMIRSIFGSNVVKDFGVVVMTNGDCFDSDVGHDKRTFKEWRQGQTGEVRDLFEDCKDRCVLFNNRTKDEGKMKEQRKLLFSMVTDIGRLYTLDEYTKADKGRTEIVVQSKLPKVEQYKNNVMREVWEEFGKIDPKYPIASCDFLELSCLLNNMKEKLLDLKKWLEEEDKTTGVLKQLFYDISVAEMRIYTKRQIVEQKLQILVSSATFVICWFVQSEFDLQKLTETISLKECSIDKDGHICSKSVPGKDRDVSGYHIALIEICKTSSNSQQVTKTLDIHDTLSSSEKVNDVLDPDSPPKDSGQVAKDKGQDLESKDSGQVPEDKGQDLESKDSGQVPEDKGQDLESKDSGQVPEDKGRDLESKDSGQVPEDKGQDLESKDSGQVPEDKGRDLESKDSGQVPEDKGQDLESKDSGQVPEDKGQDLESKDSGQVPEDKGQDLESKDSGQVAEDKGQDLESKDSGQVPEDKGQDLESKDSGQVAEDKGQDLESKDSGQVPEDKGQDLESKDSGQLAEDKGQDLESKDSGQVPDDKGQDLESKGSGQVAEDKGQDLESKDSGRVPEDKGQDLESKDSGQVSEDKGQDLESKDRKLVAKSPGHSKPKDNFKVSKIMFEPICKQLKHDNLNHVIFLISKYEQKLTKQEIDLVVQKATKIYSTNEIKNHSILILTCDKDYLEAETPQILADWCQKETGTNEQLLKACGNRCVLLNPRPKNEGTSSDGGLTRPAVGLGTGNTYKNKEVALPKASSKRTKWFTSLWQYFMEKK